MGAAFYDLVDQVVVLLEQRRRLSYRALARQFELDEAGLDDLKFELIEARRAGERRALRVFLSGGTGFVGKEVLGQLAHDPDVEEDVEEIVVLIRPKTVTDGTTGAVIRVSPAVRGEQLLEQLWLDTPATRRKFRFIAGDVEQPQLGISEEERRRLKLPSPTSSIAPPAWPSTTPTRSHSAPTSRAP
jgi:hypothetical protein